MNTKCIIAYKLYDLSPKIDKKRREPSARASFSLCGTVIVPGGEAGLTAENGKVTISGGTVREP